MTQVVAPQCCEAIHNKIELRTISVIVQHFVISLIARLEISGLHGRGGLSGLSGKDRGRVSFSLSRTVGHCFTLLIAFHLRLLPGRPFHQLRQ